MLMTRQCFCFSLMFLSLTGQSIAIGSESNNESPRGKFGRLESYEPNLLGIRYDDNDVGPYLDFKISLKYPLFHSGKPMSPHYGWLPRPYLAFTGRFSQYINTRNSSPVISKRFNPEVFGRYWRNPNCSDINGCDYLDIAYGHESNGQSISSPSAFQDKQRDLIEDEEDPEFATDYLSRGWDYLGLKYNLNHTISYESYKKELSWYLGLRYFLKDGLLQGSSEEFDESWETDPEGKPRRSVDGINVSLKLKTDFLDNTVVRSQKIFFRYTTGYQNPFKYNSLLAELTVEFFNIPVMLWVSHGYNNDLADYYREVTGGGLCFEFITN